MLMTLCVTPGGSLIVGGEIGGEPLLNDRGGYSGEDVQLGIEDARDVVERLGASSPAGAGAASAWNRARAEGNRMGA
jgi:hypothetical protein